MEIREFAIIRIVIKEKAKRGDWRVSSSSKAR